MSDRLNSERGSVFCLVAILFGAAALRLINIGAEPFWVDEILSRNIALSFDGVREMVAYVGQVEVHPPLYYVLLRGWISFFGASETALRLLSLLFSLGVVLMSFELARRIFADRRIALLAAGLTAVLPLQIEYGQEARPYSAICLMGCLAVLAVWEHLRSGRRSWLALYVAASAAGMYLHYSYSLVLGATCLWWLAESFSVRGNRRRLWAWFGSHAAVFVAYWPWLDEMLFKILLGRFELFGMERTVVNRRTSDMFGDTLESLVWASKDGTVNLVHQTSMLLAVLVFLALVLTLVRSGLRSRRERRAFAVTSFLAAMPAVLFMYSPMSLDYTVLGQRHVLFALVPLAVLVAAVAVRSGRKLGLAFVAVLLASLLVDVGNVLGNDAKIHYRHRLIEAAEYINEQYREGDLVIVTHVFNRSAFESYLNPGIPVEVLVPTEFYGTDLLVGPSVMGFLENEFQARFLFGTQEQIFDKLDRLDREHAPSRIWFYGLVGIEMAEADRWFDRSEWRHSFPQVSSLFLVDSYTRKK